MQQSRSRPHCCLRCLRCLASGHHTYITAASLSRDCSMLLTASWDRSVKLWQLQNVKKPRKLCVLGSLFVCLLCVSLYVFVLLLFFFYLFPCSFFSCLNSFCLLRFLNFLYIICSRCVFFPILVETSFDVCVFVGLFFVMFFLMCLFNEEMC